MERGCFRRFNTLFWNMLASLLAAMCMSGVLVFAIAWGLRYPGPMNPILQGPMGNDRVAFAAAAADIGGIEGLEKWISLQRSGRHQPRLFAIDDEGRSLGGIEPPAETLAVARAEHAKNPDASGIRKITADGREFLVFSARLSPVSFWTESGRFFFGPHPAQFWTNCLISISVAVLFAFILAWRISRPVRRLEEAMDQAAAGDLSVRVAGRVGSSSREFRRLAERFDKMAGTIGQLIERQQNLFHSVSHELRSPLARMNCAVELARRSPEKTPAMLDRIETDVKTLDSLVGDLLTYTRLRAEVPSAALEPADFDLCELLAEIADNASLEAERKNVRIECVLPEGELPVRFSPQAIGHAVENVVRNALRFSPEGGAVRICAEAAGPGRVRVAVEDEGPGMPPEEIPRMFEPFARGANQATGSGYGLGLAIARQATACLKGSLQAENVKPHGLRMVFDLPDGRSPDGQPASAASTAS